MVQWMGHLTRVKIPHWQAKLVAPIQTRIPSLQRANVQKRFASNPADGPDFVSVVDNPPTLVRAGRRHGPGLIILGIVFLLFSLTTQARS